jgi:hypothetical protein
VVVVFLICLLLALFIWALHNDLSDLQREMRSHKHPHDPREGARRRDSCVPHMRVTGELLVAAGPAPRMREERYEAPGLLL